VEVAMSGQRFQSLVLIVEDEPLIRLCGVKALEDAGYNVVEATNADEAIAILECRNDICFVFTDIHMPGSMDGLKLAYAVRHRWPPIKIILTSGRSNLSKEELPNGCRFLPKPYDVQAITNTLEQWGV
jgi:CheY-like chemotaxis protein